MGELQQLLSLQQIELKLEKLQKQLKELPVFAEYKHLQAQAADAKEALGWADDKLQEHKKRARRLEGQLQAAEEESKAVQERLYSASGQSAKELEQLERKAAALIAERQKQEEQMLLAMQGTEDLEAALEKAREDNLVIQKQLRQKQKSGNEEINILKEEIRQLREEREQILQQVSKPLADEYRSMRKQYSGRPLARLENDICSGCRVSVSSKICSQLNNPNSKINCDNCGRLLVPGE